MQSNQTGGVLARMARAVLLVLAVAVSGRLAYELLRPVIPLAVALLVLYVAWLLVTRRR